ncbi:MAG: hypothetical protein AAB840_01930 [Patescibacteria group bacterium]
MSEEVEIRKDAKRLRLRVERFVKSQLPLWCEVPYWMLQADSFISGDYYYYDAYGPSKKLLISPLRIFVNLNNGVLEDLMGKPLSASKILPLAYCLELVKARIIISDLQRLIKAKVNNPEAPWITKSRADCAVKFGIAPPKSVIKKK